MEFDRFAGEYRRIHSESIKLTGADSDYFSEYKVREMKKQLKGCAVNRILDLGCGDANSTVFLKKYFQASEVHGLDPSRQSIEAAKARRLPGCHFIEGKAEDGLPFPDGYFDLVFVSCVMHHIDNEQHPGILKELARVCGGKSSLFIFEHNPRNPVTRLFVKKCVFDEDAELIDAGSLKRVFEVMKGFKTVRIRYTIFMPRYLFFRAFLFIENWLHWLPLGGQYYIHAVKQ